MQYGQYLKLLLPFSRLVSMFIQKSILFYIFVLSRNYYFYIELNSENSCILDELFFEVLYINYAEIRAYSIGHKDEKKLAPSFELKFSN